MTSHRYNPLEGLPGPVLGELLTKVFATRSQILDERLAPNRPDLWGREAKWQVECLKDQPPGLTLSELSRQLFLPNRAKEMGIIITLSTDDGQVAS